MNWMDILPILLLVLIASDVITLLGRNEEGDVVVVKHPFELSERLLRGGYSLLTNFEEPE